MAEDVHGTSFRVIVTEGTTADCTQAEELTVNIMDRYLLADNWYDSNEIIAQAKNQGMEPVIPRRRKIQRPYDKDWHKHEAYYREYFPSSKRLEGYCN
jgi:hypothetical protein